MRLLLFRKVGQIRNGCWPGWHSGLQYVGRSKPQRLRNYKAATELTRSLSRLQVDQESPAHTCCQCELILAHSEGLPAASNERSERASKLRSFSVDCVVILDHDLHHVPDREHRGGGRDSQG